MSRRILAPSIACGLALALAACFAKTTSVGGNGSTPDGSAGDLDAGAAPDSTVVDADVTFGNSCKIGTPGDPVTISVCGPDEYCRSADGSCGGPSFCTARPGPTPPVCMGTECGCDGVLRCGDSSRTIGVDVAPAGFCSFPCGPKSCDAVTQYCWHGAGGVLLEDGGTFHQYECKPIPAACNEDHSCSCLNANEPGGGMCEGSNGRLTLNVPLP